MITCTCEKNSGKPGNSRCTGLSSIDLNCSLPKFLKVREPLLYVDRGIRGGVRWRDDIFQRLRHINVGSALYRHGEQVGRVVSTHGGLPMGRCLTMKQWRGRSRSPWVTPLSWTIPFLRHSPLQTVFRRSDKEDDSIARCESISSESFSNLKIIIQKISKKKDQMRSGMGIYFVNWSALHKFSSNSVSYDKIWRGTL